MNCDLINDTIKKTFEKIHSDNDEKVFKFINLIGRLSNNGGVYFQLDDRVLSQFNKESYLFNHPIAKIADKDRNIIDCIDLKRWGIGVSLASDILVMFGLCEIL